MNHASWKLLSLLCGLPVLLAVLSGCAGEGDSFPANNDVVAETAWVAVDDGSWLVFSDSTEYAWYQDRNETEDNYFAGTYEFFQGEPALTHLTEDLAEYGVTKEEMQGVFDRNEEYALENFVCMTVVNHSFLLHGEEQLEQEQENSYFGFLLQDGTYLDIANMTTGSYYGFRKDTGE